MPFFNFLLYFLFTIWYTILLIGGEIDMDIGNSIRTMRKKRKMTLKQVADIMGCSPQLISQYETGHRIPKINTLKKFADALGCEITDICDDNAINETYVKNEIAKAQSKFKLEKLKEEQRRLEKEQDELMLYMYRLLNAEGRTLAMDYIFDLVKLQEHHQNDDKGNPESPHPDAPESPHCESTKISPDEKGK